MAGEKSNQSNNFLESPVKFVQEGNNFLSKCKKPNLKEYMQIIRAVGMGFVAVGIIGYAIKLIHIPIRYIIV